eukprot:CAMPEP_0172778850 /NCGR_PEP_ID=MMETSP1074-20121228/202120_1 /TAXON_ID=2916 /ORGANISM="Ceratium fusus, Strain PA161109" /LENGTH=382 /DNA_ID=CAMNT_0013615799 /DNA_START=291 /DNA_END=1440 /DNA_ORIENTATION=-
MWAGLVCGYSLGDRYWYEHTVNYYNVKGMASYINIDRLRQVLQPLEILLCAVATSFEFWIVYWSRCFSLRYADPPTAWLLVLWCLTACIALTLVAAMKYRSGKKSRAWIAIALTMWAGLVCGYSLGDRYWYEHTVNYYNVKGMASYINIDPATDKGESYMDAGIMYFKEDSRVRKETAVAFRNGMTYCVAPIMAMSKSQNPVEALWHRQAALSTSGQYAGIMYFKEDSRVRKETAVAFRNGMTYCVAPIMRHVQESKPGGGPVAPPSGTVDFWAVGVDCCGKKGETFTCGEVGTSLARSGLRLMDGTARSMFLLGVQEWSAGTGLPVRHPVFFHWVVDPIITLEGIISAAWENLWLNLFGCFVGSLIMAFVLHLGLQKLRVL